MPQKEEKAKNVMLTDFGHYKVMYYWDRYIYTYIDLSFYRYICIYIYIDISIDL